MSSIIQTTVSLQLTLHLHPHHKGLPILAHPHRMPRGFNVTARMEMLDKPSATIPMQVQKDLLEVRNKIEEPGGLISQKPPDLE